MGEKEKSPSREARGSFSTGTGSPMKHLEVKDEVAAALANYDPFNVPIPDTQPDRYYIPPNVVKLCASLLSRFTTKESPDEYLKSQLPRVQAQYGDNDVYTMVNLFFGVLDRNNLFLYLVSSFRCSKLGRILLWDLEGTCEFEVISYLIFFEAQNLTHQNLLEIFTEYNWYGAKPFYRFLVSNCLMESEMFKALQHVYAPEYAQSVLLANLQYCINPLKNTICPGGCPSKAQIRARQTTTVVKPFKFTDLQPRRVELLDEPDPPFRAGTVPRSNFVEPKPSVELGKQYEANRLKALLNIQAILELEKRSQLYSDETKSYHFYRKISKIKMEREKIIEQSRYIPNRIPLEDVLKEQEPNEKAKPTVADLMRRRHICLDQEQKAESKIMEDLEIGVDPAEAERRVARLRQEEEEARKKELEEQKREAKLAFHRAVAARRKFYEMNKEVVKKLKDETESMVKARMHMEEQEVEKQREVNHHLLMKHELKKRSDARKAKLEREEREKLKREEKFKRMETLYQMEMERMAEKKDKALKVQAERIIKRWKKRTPAAVQVKTTPFQGLNRKEEPMSNTELQIRLHVVRQQAQVDQEKARARILISKMERAAKIKSVEMELEACRRRKQEQSKLNLLQGIWKPSEP